MIVIKELKATGSFTTMSQKTDETEHSLEMHLPYIYVCLKNFYGDLNDEGVPKLVPIMIGNTSPEKEKEYGKLFAPYVADKENIFIISSDFCHWYYHYSTLIQGPSIRLYVL